MDKAIMVRPTSWSQFKDRGIFVLVAFLGIPAHAAIRTRQTSYKPAGHEDPSANFLTRYSRAAIALSIRFCASVKSPESK
jgi:hypothetical protein